MVKKENTAESPGFARVTECSGVTDQGRGPWAGVLAEAGGGVYARLPQGEHPVTHAHIDALGGVDQKAVYDATVEAVLSAAAHSSGNA
ncbi:hypothetical protein ACWCRF_23330 [Streptomyces sp. NPDC002405]|uniref:hypothetical protein n=1 Tax=Streptomyces sp. NPDC001231 TaxID=3364549 RepID=UPI0036AFC892